MSILVCGSISSVLSENSLSETLKNKTDTEEQTQTWLEDQPQPNGLPHDSCDTIAARFISSHWSEPPCSYGRSHYKTIERFRTTVGVILFVVVIQIRCTLLNVETNKSRAIKSGAVIAMQQGHTCWQYVCAEVPGFISDIPHPNSDLGLEEQKVKVEVYIPYMKKYKNANLNDTMIDQCQSSWLSVLLRIVSIVI